MKKKIIIIMFVVVFLIVLVVFLVPKSTKDTFAVGDTLVEYVKRQNPNNESFWDHDSGDGVYITNNGNEYRYVGADPNNYVWFNNDLYRIIGVFDENTHGVVDENGNGVELVKLIRARILGSYSWGVHSVEGSNGEYFDCNSMWAGYDYMDRDGYNWSISPTNLNILLNEYFLENKSTTYGNCEDWTYYYNSSEYRNFNCSDIYGYSIKESSGLQDYIEEVTWSLNGFDSAGYSKQDFYDCEYGSVGMWCGVGYFDAGYQFGIYESISRLNDSVYKGKIGLMSVSDYLYASGYSGSENTNMLPSVNSNFGNKNWLFKGFEWTMTAVNDLSGWEAFTIISSARIEAAETYLSRGVRPVFYLKNSVYVTGGDGTFDNPYTISN